MTLRLLELRNFRLRPSGARKSTMTSPALQTLAAAFVLGSTWSVPMAHGQVVNLPSVGTFSSSGSVWVPDQGDVGLGGYRRSASGQTSRGMLPPGSRAAGSTAAAGSLSASAVIIDLQAMDAALLAEAESKRPTSASRYSGPVQGIPAPNVLRQEAPPTTVHIPTRKPANRPPFSEETGAPKSIRPDYLGGSGAIHDEAEIRHFMERAHQAQVLGRFASAQVYYRLALERMTPEARDRMVAWREKMKQEEEAAQAGTRGVSGPGASTGNRPTNGAAGNSMR